MLVKIDQGWIYIVGFKIIRTSFSINSSNFPIIYDMINSIAPYVSIRIHNGSAMLFIIIFDKNDSIVLNKAKKIIKQIIAIITIQTFNSSGIQFKRLLEADIQNENQKFHSPLSTELEKINFPFKTNFDVFKEEKNCIIKYNNIYKLTVLFKKLCIKGSITSTLKALLNINANIVIGSEKYGQKQYLSIEFISFSRDEVINSRNLLIEILQFNPNISGNLEILKYRYVKDNKMLSSLGITHYPIDNQIIRNILYSVPECLNYKTEIQLSNSNPSSIYMAQ